MKNSNNSSLFYSVKTVMKKALKASPIALFFTCLSNLLHSIVISINFIIENRMIDTVTSITNETFMNAVKLILIFFALRLLSNTLYVSKVVISNFYGPSFDKKLRLNMIDKFEKIDLINYEDSSLHDIIKRSSDSCYNATNGVRLALQVFFAHLSGILGVLLYLCTVRWEIALIVLLAAIPEILNYINKGYKKNIVIKNLTPLIRRLNYLKDAIISRNCFKETRLLGAYELLKAKWSLVLDKYNKKEWQIKKKLLNSDLLNIIIDFISYALVLSLTTYYLYVGKLSIGQFSATLSALVFFRLKVKNLVSNLGAVIEDFIATKNMFDFLNLEEKKGANQIVHPVESIKLVDVDFKYKTNKEYIIKNINLEINKGDVVAIVGNNGAGKTTLVKLITGLLEPSSGKVLYNGIDVKTVSEESLFDKTSALFQTFGKYQMTLRENIAIGNPENIHNDAMINKCLDASSFSFDKERLKDGLDSMLGTEFGGIELSGGQWQQIGFARAFFKNSDFIVLDEPTSAIDPIRESSMYENLEKICKSKTTLLITHRLSATKLANKIIVLNKGEIAEVGTHEELMRLGKSYAKLYYEQAKWYNI